MSNVLRRGRWRLLLVLIVALSVDIMKPATLDLGGVRLLEEYGIPKAASLLALVAPIGTTGGACGTDGGYPGEASRDPDFLGAFGRQGDLNSIPARFRKLLRIRKAELGR